MRRLSVAQPVIANRAARFVQNKRCVGDTCCSTAPITIVSNAVYAPGGRFVSLWARVRPDT